MPVRDRGRSPSDKRAEAVAAILARDAADDPIVASFRESALRRKLLKPADIEQWVQRHAKEDGRATTYLRVPLPGNTDITISQDGLVPTPTFQVGVDHPAVGTEVEVLEYGVPGETWVRRLPVTRDSVLHELKNLSKTLAQRYGWQSAQATGFVLCGLAPELTSLKAEVSIRTPEVTSRIILSIDPALSPADVARAYKLARSRISTSRHRPLQEKKQMLAIFMASRPTSETKRRAMDAWNQKYPNWKYSEIRNFGRDAAAARLQLLNPFHLSARMLFPQVAERVDSRDAAKATKHSAKR
jgi:hypothetical protein